MGEIQARGPTLLNLRIIWGSLLMSIAIYGIVAAMVAPPMRATAVRGAGDPILVALHGVALAVLAVAFAVPRAMMRRSGEGRPGILAAAPGSGGVTRGVFSAMIVRWAMIEAVAILGLVAALLSADPRAFLPLGVVAIAGMLLSYPGARVEGGA